MKQIYILSLVLGLVSGLSLLAGLTYIHGLTGLLFGLFFVSLFYCALLGCLDKDAINTLTGKQEED